MKTGGSTSPSPKDDDDLGDDERRWVLGWIDTHSGWSGFLEPAHGEALGDMPDDLPVPYVALPDELARAGAHLWNGTHDSELPAPERPGSGRVPPADYDPSPVGPEEPGQIVPELEAVLRIYLDHPAYRAHLARTTRHEAD